MSKVITVEDIIELFKQAADTDKRLPPAIRKQQITAWLDYRQEKMYKHSYHKASFKIVPNARDIARWEIASWILRELVKELDMRKIIWLRGRRFPFTQLGRIFGYTRKQIKNKYLEEIIYLRLWLQLHQNDKKISDIIDKIVLNKI